MAYALQKQQLGKHHGMNKFQFAMHEAIRSIPSLTRENHEPGQR